MTLSRVVIVSVLFIFCINALQVKFYNGMSNPLCVTFTGDASWGSTCSPPFQPGTVCYAQVGNVGGTRFCGSLTTTEDCNDAQNLNLTMIETNFVNDIVWVDISVIPAACTDSDWYADGCANTGGASYNAAVSISCDTGDLNCGGHPGTNGYPTNCGNPEGSCVGQNNTDCCQAYFYPDPPAQPVLVCQYLDVSFYDI